MGNGFKPNREFRKRYDQLFREDPQAANLFLLLAELADEKGQAKLDPAELAELISTRFGNPRRYAL